MVSVNKNIEDEKFSDVEVYNNGIAITAKTGKIDNNTFKTVKVYIRNEDMDQIVDMFADVISNTTEEDYQSDDIQDAIY